MFVVDLDGTVFDHSWRVHHVLEKPKNWEAYYEGMGRDEPIIGCTEPLQRMAQMYHMNGLTFLTGRPEKYRGVTAERIAVKFRLETYNPINGTYDSNAIPLIMRPHGDRRSSVVFKESMIQRFFSMRSEQFIFIDDDSRNDEMYLKYGVLLKAPGCWQFMP